MNCCYRQFNQELYKLSVQAYAGRFFVEYLGDPDQHNTGKKKNDMIIYV